jgi:uncharacterized protein with FMN-binding domain
VHRYVEKSDTFRRATYTVASVASLGALVAAYATATDSTLVRADASVPDVAEQPAVPLADGVFVGETQLIASGPLTVTMTVTDGRIAQLDVDFPRGNRHSRALNDRAVPQLVESALEAQGTDIDLVTGATATTAGFIGSLQDAIDNARH